MQKRQIFYNFSGIYSGMCHGRLLAQLTLVENCSIGNEGMQGKRIRHPTLRYTFCNYRSNDFRHSQLEILEKNSPRVKRPETRSQTKINLKKCNDGNFKDLSKSTSCDFDAVAIYKLLKNIARQKLTVRNYATSVTSTVAPEMPEPQGLPLIGTTFSLIRAGGASRLHEYVDKRHKELGPVYKERMGSVTAVFVSSPNEYRRIFRLEGPRPKHLLPEAWILYNKMRKCERGLFFMEGDEWLHFRRIMNKLLLRPESDDFILEPCKQAAKNLVTDCHSYAEKGVAIPQLEEKLYQWSIEVMMAVLIGSTWPQHRSNILSRSEKLATNLRNIFHYSGQLSLLPVKLAMNLKLPFWNKFVTSVDIALGIVRELVREMIKLEGDGLIKIFMTEKIQDDDLIRIVADLILAAGDTTAYSMQWGLFLIASEPKIQKEVFENSEPMNEEDVIQNPLLKGVIKEALRLYPTAPFLTRFLPGDSLVGGYHVAKGNLILMSLYTSGRDENNFKNAENFSPKRWLRNEKGEYNGVINPHASLPFALGARSCVGRKIAEMQLTLTMAEMIRNFKMECTNQDRVKMILHLVSVPSEPIQLVMRAR